MFRRIQRATGQALVEFALAGVIIFLLFSAAVDLGMIFYTLQGLNNAAQEGAFYGSILRHFDGDAECRDLESPDPSNPGCDMDGDGFIEGDIFYYNDDEQSLSEVTYKEYWHEDPEDDSVSEEVLPNGSIFPAFKDEVRKRVVYEAGNTTSGYGDYLLDLNGNDIPDKEEYNDEGEKITERIRREYIQVSVIKGDSVGGTLKAVDPVTPPPDELLATYPLSTTYQAETTYDTCVRREKKDGEIEYVDPRSEDIHCYVKVRVATLHQIIFPLTPSFGREVTLQSGLAVPINTSGFTLGGGTFTEVVTPIKSRTPTTMTPTPPPTMTPTPNPFCTLYFTKHFTGTPGYTATVKLPWYEEHVSTVSEVSGDGYTKKEDTDPPPPDNTTTEIGLCSAGLQISDQHNDFYYVYSERDDDARNVYFDVRLTKWIHPGTYKQDSGSLEPVDPTPTGSYSRTVVGPMIRESTDTNANFVMLGYRPRTNDGTRTNPELAFLYRRTDSNPWTFDDGRIQEGAKVSLADDHLPLLWLRLHRADPRIIGYYSTKDNPTDDDWIKIGDWQDAVQSDSATFGIAQASGTDFGDDKRFAISTFENVQFSQAPALDAQIWFVLPKGGIVYEPRPDGTEPISNTNFMVNITTTKELEFNGIVYTLESPAQSPALEAADYPREWAYNESFTCSSAGTAEPDNDVCDSPDLLCVFGTMPDDDDTCKPMPQGLYDDLQQRGSDRPYRITAQLILADEFDMSDIPPAQADFYIEPAELDFFYPTEDMHDSNLVAESTGAITSAFRITFYDPKYGRADGDGIQDVWHYIRFPSPAGEEIWYSSGQRNADGFPPTDESLADLMCLFGGKYSGNPDEPFDCDEWPGTGLFSFTRRMDTPENLPPEDLEDLPPEDLPPFEELQAGNYQLMTYVMPRGGKGDYLNLNGNSEAVSVYSSLNILPATVLFSHRMTETTETTIWDEADIPTVDHEDTAYFTIRSFVPHVGPENGDGLDEAKLQITKVSNGSYIYSRTVDIDSEMIGEEWACVFGTPDPDSGCPPMNQTTFNRLQSGIYELKVSVSNNNGKDWVEHTREFELLEPPVHVDFVLEDDTIPEDVVHSLGVITSGTKMLFRAQAYTNDLIDDDGDGLADNNGFGIERLEFQLFDPDGEIIQDGGNDYFLVENKYPPDDIAPALFCMFGDVGDCKPMDSDLYDRLTHGDYRLVVRAVSRDDSAAAGRLSNPKELTFTIPEMVVDLVDPDPDPDEDDGRYDDDGRKFIIHREELTRFEMKAYDPKYGGTNYADDFGEGIVGYEFKIIYEPDDEDEEMEDISDLYKLTYDGGTFTFESTDTLPDSLGDDYRRTYDGSEQDDMPPMCAYGEDEDNDRPKDWKGRDDDDDTEDDEVNCAPMPDDDDEYTSLEDGIYLIKVRTANRAEWTPWVEREIRVPGIVVEFVEPPQDISGSVVISDNIETAFYVEAYDPKARTDFEEEPENGDGIEEIEFVLFDPEGTPILTRTVDQAAMLPTVPDYYCAFGPSSATPCNTIDEYQEDLFDTLPRGTYRLVVRAEGASDDAVATMEFEIQPNKEVVVSFAHPTTDTLVINKDNYDTDATEFEAEAFWAKVGQTAPNGTNIEEVEISLGGPGVITSTTAITIPYYYFEDGNHRMPLEFFRLLSGGTYTMTAKATALNGDTDEVTTSFIVPDYTFDFVDATGTPVAGDLITFTQDISSVVRVAQASGSMDDDEVEIRFELVGEGTENDADDPFCLTYENNGSVSDCATIGDYWDFNTEYTVVATALEKDTGRVLDEHDIRFTIVPDFKFDFIDPATDDFVTTRSISFTDGLTLPIVLEVRQKSGGIAMSDVEIGFRFVTPSYSTIFTDTSTPICIGDERDTSGDCEQIPDGGTTISDDGYWKYDTTYTVIAEAAMRSSGKSLGTRELTFSIEPPDFTFINPDTDTFATSDLITVTNTVTDPVILEIRDEIGIADMDEVTFKFTLEMEGDDRIREKDDDTAPFCVGDQNYPAGDCVKDFNNFYYTGGAWKYGTEYTLTAEATHKTTGQLLGTTVQRFVVTPDIVLDYLHPLTGEFVSARAITITDALSQPLFFEVGRKSGSLDLSSDIKRVRFTLTIEDDPTNSVGSNDTDEPFCVADKNGPGDCTTYPSDPFYTSNGWKYNKEYTLSAEVTDQNNQTWSLDDLRFIIQPPSLSTQFIDPSTGSFVASDVITVTDNVSPSLIVEIDKVSGDADMSGVEVVFDVEIVGGNSNTNMVDDSGAPFCLGTSEATDCVTLKGNISWGSERNWQYNVEYIITANVNAANNGETLDTQVLHITILPDLTMAFIDPATDSALLGDTLTITATDPSEVVIEFRKLAGSMDVDNDFRVSFDISGGVNETNRRDSKSPIYCLTDKSRPPGNECQKINGYDWEHNTSYTLTATAQKNISGWNDMDTKTITFTIVP